MNTSTRIQWKRVLIGGFLAEASVFAIVLPIFCDRRSACPSLRRAIGIIGDVFLVRSLGRDDGSNHGSSCTDC
jgi:hypothetical protein